METKGSKMSEQIVECWNPANVTLLSMSLDDGVSVDEFLETKGYKKHWACVGQDDDPWEINWFSKAPNTRDGKREFYVVLYQGDTLIAEFYCLGYRETIECSDALMEITNKAKYLSIPPFPEDEIVKAIRNRHIDSDIGYEE